MSWNNISILPEERKNLIFKSIFKNIEFEGYRIFKTIYDKNNIEWNISEIESWKEIDNDYKYKEVANFLNWLKAKKNNLIVSSLNKNCLEEYYSFKSEVNNNILTMEMILIESDIENGMFAFSDNYIKNKLFWKVNYQGNKKWFTFRKSKWHFFNVHFISKRIINEKDWCLIGNTLMQCYSKNLTGSCWIRKPDGNQKLIDDNEFPKLELSSDYSFKLLPLKCLEDIRRKLENNNINPKVVSKRKIMSCIETNNGIIVDTEKLKFL